jgi:glycosyltransferase involved in cell wall biosynthesis
LKPPPSTQGGHVDRSNPGHQSDILVITDRRFWRRSIGSEQRIAALIVHLARLRERVTCVYVGRVTAPERVLLSRFLSSTTGLEVVSRPSDPTTLWRGIRNRLRRPSRLDQLPRTPAIAADSILDRDSPGRRAFVQSVIRERRPRIVIVEFLRLSYCVFPLDDSMTTDRPTRYWIDTHDVLHRRAERYRAAGATVARNISASDEIRALENYDAILAIQKPEAALFGDLLPNKTVIVVPHGIALPILPDRPVIDPGPLRIGFLGGRDESNRDALDWFVAEIWPKIRSRFGIQVELAVAGQVCHLWHPRHEGVVLLGPIESIDLFWPEIDIAINPIRFGSGLKIKNVEALAFGRPLITTSIGAEGLESASPRGLRIADSEIEWTRALVEWISEPETAASVARAGRAHAEAHLSEEAAFRDLASRINDTLSEQLS